MHPIRTTARPSGRGPAALAAATSVLLLLATIALAACGGANSTPAPASPDPAATTTPAASSAGPTAAPEGDGGDTGSGLVALVPADLVATALGETPDPECDTSSLTGAATCVWTAADGSWLKVEDGTPAEMPDLASFTDRVTGTLGLDEKVDGLGEAAYLGTSSRGTRIAVFMGDGRTVWVVLNRAGDAASQAPLVTEIASALVGSR